MPKITRLKTQARRQNRVNLELDSKFAIGISLGRAVQSKLKVGDFLSENELELLKTQDDLDHVLEKILNFLSYRPRSTFEVKTRLQKYTSNQAVYSEALAYLQKHNLIDDPTFCCFWIKARRYKRSTRAITYELRQKGVSPEIITQALAQEEPGDIATLQKLLLKKFSIEKLTDHATKSKVYRFAQARGFSYDNLQKALQDIQEAC